MTTTLLSCKGLSAGYDGIPAIANVSLDVRTGECVAVLGRNGVGKTTLARAIAGLLGRPLAGSVSFDGKDISNCEANQRAHLGLIFTPDDRGIFRQLTVEENLQLAARSGCPVSGSVAAEGIPILLVERWRHRAGQLSGGEQQILAIACALKASPRLLVIDELSEGLSARAVSVVEGWLSKRIATGLSVLLIEQRVDLALRLASRCYIMDLANGHGGFVLAAEASTLRDDPTPLIKHLAL